MSLKDIHLPETEERMRWKLKRYGNSSSILLLQKKLLFFWVTEGSSIISSYSINRKTVQECLTDAACEVIEDARGLNKIKPYYGSV